MRIERVSERAMIVSDLGVEPWNAARAIRNAAIKGVADVTTSIDSVGMYLANAKDYEGAAEAIWKLELHVCEERKLGHHNIPICYELGDDLEFLMEKLSLSRNEIASIHCEPEYRCVSIGFQPGFPYLQSLLPPLWGLPRREQPRPRVAPGSVGIALDQTGIYPAESPGGWHLVGRTPLVICEPSEGIFPIAPGDTIRFLPITLEEYRQLRGQRL